MAEELTELFKALRRDVVADLEEGLERRFEAKITALRDEMNSHFDDVYARFDRLEELYSAHAPVSS